MLFAQRLNRVLAGRALSSWAMRLGLGRDATRALEAGRVPGATAVQRICRVEGVRRRWLLEGRGPAFTVAQAGNDEATAMAVATMLDEYPGWSRYIVSDGRTGLVVLTRPAELPRPRCAYTIVAMLSGEVGERTLGVLDRGGSWLEVAAQPGMLENLRAGLVGPYSLVGDGVVPGLLSHPG